MFKEEWIDPSKREENQQWADWLGKENEHTARCALCNKSIKLSNMGVRALISHLEGKKHKKNVAAKDSQSSVQNLFKQRSEVEVHDVSIRDPVESPNRNRDEERDAEMVPITAAVGMLS